MRQDVIDQTAQKRDIASRSNLYIFIATGAGAAEAWIDVNQRRAAFTRFHRPAETNRMGLRHVGAHDQDAVGVGQILLEISSRAAAEGGAQTGHRCAMSYPRLI